MQETEIPAQTRLLKAHDVRGLGSKVVFNLEDLRQRGDSYLDSVRKQIEGQIAWALSDVMWQEITIKDGRVVEGNFDQYQVARMAYYPREVNIEFLKTNNKWISGVGEEAIPQIAPAMAQAIFKITGKRIRSLPIGAQDLRRT